MFVSSLLTVVYRRAHKCLIYVFCLFVCVFSDQNILHCVVLCFVCLRLVYLDMFPVSMDGPVLIAFPASVFSNIYFYSR